MQTSTNIPLVPGDVSVNVLEAVKMAVARFPRTRTPVGLSRDYLDRVKGGLNGVKPSLERVRSALTYPAKPRAYYRIPVAYELPRDKRKRVKRELLDAGVTLYGLAKSESRYLPKIIHDNEHIEAVIYGQHNSSSAMMAATDERIIYLDKKPMIELFDEVSYEVVSGIGFDIHLFLATVVLHTPVKNYDFKFVNLHCAEKFARHIERQRLERKQAQKTEEPVIEVLPPALESPRHPYELEEDMAGYYWLPMEEEERRKVQTGP